jgi:hypothetical protein
MRGNKRNRTMAALVLVIGIAMIAACQTAPAAKPSAMAPAAAPAKATIAKLCANCHTAQAGSLRGNFDSVAYKTRSIQIKIDSSAEILRFDPASLKIENVQGENPDELLRDIPKGKEVRVEYTEKDGTKLVAMGPEQGKYTLIDARPPVKFMEGTIPTAINIPFVAFDKMVDKLPKEKDALIVYFCQGCS